MSVSSVSLRALVTERLTAAAEEIFALVERTIAEYEEELCRSKEENQRNQQLLEQLLSSHRGTDGENPDEEVGPRLKQENLGIPEFSFPCVKREQEEHERDFPQNQAEAKTEISFESLEQTDFSSRSENVQGEFTWNLEPPIDEEFEAEEVDLYEQTESAGDKASQGVGITKRKAVRTPNPCAVCGKVFLNSRDLKRHTVVHTGEKPFSCSLCEKRFTRKGSLASHMMIHSGCRPFSCSVCGKTFAQKGNLQVHVVLHSTERPFSCSVCGARFSTRPPLIRHQKLHTGVKPFSCSFCDRGFSRKEHLRKHLLTHTAT